MTKSRATLLVLADEPEHVAAAHQWIEEHRRLLDFVSENLGCGCCVDMWQVEGDAAVIDMIPPELVGGSPWDTGREA